VEDGILTKTGMFSPRNKAQPKYDINWCRRIRSLGRLDICNRLCRGECLRDIFSYRDLFGYKDEYPVPIKGRLDNTIQQYYEEQKGPKAYLGTTVPGFPNFFLIFGLCLDFKPRSSLILTKTYV
jgi:hypothetical protein